MRIGTTLRVQRPHAGLWQVRHFIRIITIKRSRELRHPPPLVSSILNGTILIQMFTNLAFYPSLATPLPEEFELQGFLALRPSFRWVAAGGRGVIAGERSVTVNGNQARE